jgi:dTDP-glucose pyrophosphorylase
VHGLILAGGEGSRLRNDGIGTPKALVEVAGSPQILRLLNTLSRLGCSPVTCMVRNEFPAVLAVLARQAAIMPDLRVIPCRTPSSLHTLVGGLKAIPDGPVFCTMVDTIMPEKDWNDVYTQTKHSLDAGAGAVLAVTPFVDDERALYVEVDGDGWVRRLDDEPVDPICVTGGVYGLSELARERACYALDSGMSRMRSFLKLMVDEGSRVATIRVPWMIDVDRKRDLLAATERMKKEEPESPRGSEH